MTTVVFLMRGILIRSRSFLPTNFKNNFTLFASLASVIRSPAVIKQVPGSGDKIGFAGLTEIDKSDGLNIQEDRKFTF